MREIINHEHNRRNILQKLFSGGKELNEVYFRLTLLLSAIFALTGTIFYSVIDYPWYFTTWGGVVMLFFLVLLWFQIEKPQYQKIILILFILSVLITLNYYWFINGGFQSPVLIIMVSLIALLIFSTSSPNIFYISAVIGLNITVLFFIELYFPHLVKQFANEKQLLMSHIFVFVFIFAAIIPTLVLSKKKFIQEKEKAEYDNHQKSAYLANMSHEIRTPMSAIVGFAELLQQPRIKQKERDEYIFIIQQNSELLLRLINNILDLSKLEANLVSINISRFCIKSLLGQVYNAHITQTEKKGIYLETDLPEELNDAEIESDRTLLFQVFSNLITNALKVTNEGDIRFGVRLKNERLSFFVFDTGPGIPKDQQKRIFERFSQLHSYSNYKIKSNGVGLGLSICKAIVDLLGGDISLHSEVNKGSTFIFSFPSGLLYRHNYTSLETSNGINIRERIIS
jgi:signal transduction histidine kinase